MFLLVHVEVNSTDQNSTFSFNHNVNKAREYVQHHKLMISSSSRAAGYCVWFTPSTYVHVFVCLTEGAVFTLPVGLPPTWQRTVNAYTHTSRFGKRVLKGDDTSNTLRQRVRVDSWRQTGKTRCTLHVRRRSDDKTSHASCSSRVVLFTNCCSPACCWSLFPECII